MISPHDSLVSNGFLNGRQKRAFPEIRAEWRAKDVRRHPDLTRLIQSSNLIDEQFNDSEITPLNWSMQMIWKFYFFNRTRCFFNEMDRGLTELKCIEQMYKIFQSPHRNIFKLEKESIYHHPGSNDKLGKHSLLLQPSFQQIFHRPESLISSVQTGILDTRIHILHLSRYERHCIPLPFLSLSSTNV